MLESTIEAKIRLIEMFKRSEDSFHKDISENLKLEVKYLLSIKAKM